MRRDRRRVAWLAAALVAAVAATGCPDSEVFETGTFEFKLETLATNDDAWACVLASFSGQLLIKPYDGSCAVGGAPCFDLVDCGGGVCNQALAANDLNRKAILVTGAGGISDANFSAQGQPCAQEENPEAVDFPLLILSPGLYRISQLQIGKLRLIAADGSERNCEFFDTRIEDLPAYQDDLFFRVGADERNSLRFVIDAAQLLAALDDPSNGNECVLNLPNHLPQVFSIQ